MEVGDFGRALEAAERSRGIALLMEFQRRIEPVEEQAYQNAFMTCDSMKQFVETNNVTIVLYGMRTNSESERVTICLQT